MPTELSAVDPKVLDHVVAVLLPRASSLTRLVLKQAEVELTRSEASVLATLEAGPRRVSELAEREALAQPTMTLLLQRLESRGLVARDRDPVDGRVVVVSLTPDGAAALRELRTRSRAVLRDHVAGLSEGHVEALAAATEALDALLESLQDSSPSA